VARFNDVSNWRFTDIWMQDLPHVELEIDAPALCVLFRDGKVQEVSAQAAKWHGFLRVFHSAS
jgi:hypothetical protein